MQKTSSILQSALSGEVPLKLEYREHPASAAVQSALESESGKAAEFWNCFLESMEIGVQKEGCAS